MRPGRTRSFGVLKLTLLDGGYDFEFVVAPGERPYERRRARRLRLLNDRVRERATGSSRAPGGDARRTPASRRRPRESRTSGLATTAAKPASPIEPSPTTSWRSRRDPRSCFASFMWISRSRSARPSPRSSSKQRVDPLGRIERVAGREQVAGVEDEPEPVVADRVEQPASLRDRGRDGAARSGHELDEQPRGVRRLGEGRLQDRRRPFERVGRLARRRRRRRARRTRRPRARRTRATERRQSSRDLAEELRVRRGDVHEVRRVDEERTDPALAPIGPERLRRVQARPRPRPRVRDEQLRRLGADRHGRARRRCAGHPASAGGRRPSRHVDRTRCRLRARSCRWPAPGRPPATRPVPGRSRRSTLQPELGESRDGRVLRPMPTTFGIANCSRSQRHDDRDGVARLQLRALRRAPARSTLAPRHVVASSPPRPSTRKPSACSSLAASSSVAADDLRDRDRGRSVG